MCKTEWLMIAVVLPAVCAGTAAAQPGANMFQQSGNLMGANANVSGPTYYAGVNLSPQVLPDERNGQEVYVISWYVTTFTAVRQPPEPPTGLRQFSVAGVLPASDVRQSMDGISFDLDIEKLQRVLSATEVDCTAGPCVFHELASFPLKGTISPVTGAGAVSFSRSGSDDTRTVNLTSQSGACLACENTDSFNGTQTGRTANFVGTIGSMTIAPPPVGGNANLTLRKGITRRTNVCTPCPCPAM